MQKWCGSSSHAIHLSSDDEDDYDRSLSSGFGGCISCLPRFNLNGGGNIGLPEEDATLDDYLDPNTTTTVEPLLDEYNNRDRDTAFSGAVLQNSQSFLSRNPFASANTTALPPPTATITTAVAEALQGSSKATTDYDGNIDGSYQEQPYHSFTVAAPRVDFFMEDDDDAEFLSDHRISAVIGDTGKLANKFKLFDAVMDTGNPLQNNDYLEHDDGQLTKKHATTQMKPFELDSAWSNNTDLDTADVNHQSQPYYNKIDKQQNEVHDNPETNNSLCGLEYIDDLPANTVNNDFDIDGTSGLPTSIDNKYENTKYNYSQSNDDYANYANVDQMEPTEGNVASPHTSMPAHNNELTTQNSYSNSDTALTALSEPPSPIPAVSTISTETFSNKFPSTGFPRTSTQEKLSTPISPIYHTPDISAQKQSMGHPSSSSEVTDSQPFLSNASISPDVNNSSAVSSPARRDMVIENNRTEKRRPSVAAVAHSILGDKLDDFTEKLTYIRKNIISSLDDSDDNDDQYITKPNQRHQLWRPRSRSMLQNSHRLSTEGLYSTNIEKPQQQQQLSTNHPRTNHQRSNSMLDTSPSFTKFFQQLSGGSDSASNHRQFGSSSFFSSLAGQGAPSFSSVGSPTNSPQQSNDFSQLRQHHQPPKRSRSTSALASSSSSSSHTSQLSRSFSDPPLQDVTEQQEMDYEDVFEFKKVIAMGKNVRNISEDIMANGMRLFNDFSTRMKNTNVDQMEHGQTLAPTFPTIQQKQQQQHYHH